MRSAAATRGRVRIWVPCCKTGAQTYTIAMLLAEASARSAPGTKLVVFGTDDDEEALTVARAGRYPSAAGLELAPALRAGFTRDEGGALRVAEALRDVCLFSRHELLRDPPLARMDLIVCGRVFDGVAPARRADLIERFHFALREGGQLLALDHVESFSDGRFERIGDGRLRPHGRRSPSQQPRCGPQLTRAIELTQQALAPLASRLSHQSAALRLRSGDALPDHGHVGHSVHELGVPLVLCAADLRVVYLSDEALEAFDLSESEHGAELGALCPRLPGGLDLASSARQVAAHGGSRHLVSRTAQRVYLARISAAQNDGRHRSVSILFTDVTAFEAAANRAAAQQDRSAALARLLERAYGSGEPCAVYEEALDALSVIVRRCSSSAILTLTDSAELEVVASRGLGPEPLRALHAMPGGEDWLGLAVQNAPSSRGEPPPLAESDGQPQHCGRPPRRPHRFETTAARPPGIVCPIARHGEVLGALVLLGPTGGSGTEDQDFAAAVAGVLGKAIEQRRTRRRLELERAMSARFESLYDSLPVVVTIHDATGALLRINRRGARLDPTAREPAPGALPAQPSCAALERLFVEEVPTWIARVLATDEAVLGVELTVSDQRARWFWLCNFAPVRDARGNRQGVVAVMQDISALKHHEASLREAIRTKDDFFALLGHELRNPIAAIQNAAALLSRIEQRTPQLTRLQAIFDRQTTQATRLVDGLLDVTRVARNKVKLQRQPLEVVRLVRQAVDDREQQFEGYRLELRWPDGELWTFADRVRLLQIVDNLLSNALRFTPKGGQIIIEVQRLNERGAIRVVDDGAGIEAAFLPHLFEPFRQGRSRSSHGLGLGLALVKGLCDLHGFRVTGDSAGVGLGASFRVDFPLVLAPEATAPESPTESGRLDLLLVEDNGDVADTLAELLRAEGHSVDVAPSAERALEMLRERRRDVVLSDIGLPGMDGIELARRLRADPELSSSRLVALTGFGDAATEARIESAGFERTLTKPVQLEALQRCLGRMAVGLPEPASRR